MPEQSRFENVDLFASLEAILKQNTGFFQSAFDIDKEKNVTIEELVIQ